jgi:phage I-like protein
MSREMAAMLGWPGLRGLLRAADLSSAGTIDPKRKYKPKHKAGQL